MTEELATGVSSKAGDMTDFGSVIDESPNSSALSYSESKIEY